MKQEMLKQITWLIMTISLNKRSCDKHKSQNRCEISKEGNKRHSCSIILNKKDSQSRFRSEETNNSIVQIIKPDLLISVSNPLKQSSVENLRDPVGFSSPAYKSSGFSMTTTSKYNSTNKKQSSTLRKYKESAEKYQQDSMK